MAAQPQTIYKGESKKFRLTVVDEDGEAIDITGSTPHLRVKRDLADADPAVIIKTGTLLTQSGATLGQADFDFVPGDTSALAPGTYVYDSWIELASGDRHVMAIPSKFSILQPVTFL